MTGKNTNNANPQWQPGKSQLWPAWTSYHHTAQTKESHLKIQEFSALKATNFYVPSTFLPLKLSGKTAGKMAPCFAKPALNGQG
jgi:hypothetical protein